MSQLVLMQQQSALIARLITTLEKIQTEQDRAGKAIGEAGAILLNHTETLKNLGMASVRMWHELKLPVEGEPEVPPSTVN